MRFASLIPAALACVLFSSAAVAEELKRRPVLLMDLKNNNVDEATVDTIESFIAAQLAADPRLQVLAGSEVRRMLELEAERQAAGCETDASCLAEIAGALGAELVVLGQLGRLSDTYILTLTLVDTSAAEAISRNVVRVTDVGAIPDALETELPRLMAPAFDKAAATVQSTNDDEAGLALASGPVWVVGGGAALTLVGVAMGLGAVALYGRYVGAEKARSEVQTADPRPTLQQLNAEWQAAEAARTTYDTFGVALGWGGAAVGVAGLSLAAGAGAWMLLGGDAE